MEHHDGKRVPLGVLYGLLGLLFAWAVAFIVPMTRDVFTIVFRPASSVATPFVTDWPDGALQFVARDLARQSAPPLKRGDRIVSIEGQRFRANWQVARLVAAAGPRGTLPIVVARNVPGGARRRSPRRSRCAPLRTARARSRFASSSPSWAF